MYCACVCGNIGKSALSRLTYISKRPVSKYIVYRHLLRWKALKSEIRICEQHPSVSYSIPPIFWNTHLWYLQCKIKYSSLSLLWYCWDKTKVSYYPDYWNIQYKFLMLCSSWDIDRYHKQHFELSDIVITRDYCTFRKLVFKSLGKKCLAVS